MKKTILTIAAVLIVSFNTFGQTAGNSMLFDGINDFVMVPHHTSLNPGNGSWTISLWIKAPNVIQRGPLVGKRLPMEGYNQYTLGIGDTNAHFPSPGKRIYVNYIDSAGISERSGHLQNEFVDGNWHHIAMVADKTADSVFIYIDGIKQVFIIQFNFGNWPDVGNVDSLLIGRNSNGSHFYNGEMDELSLWNKALSPSQINTVMSDTLGPAYYSTSDSGLVGYWRFDQYENLGVNGGGVDDIRDLSVWGNHGDAEGSPQLIPSGILTVKNINQNHPKEFSLSQNYPNPFNPSTKIKFAISDVSYTKLKVYDALGKEVATLVNERLSAGSYEVDWNANNYGSGVYFYKLEAGDYAETRKMLFLK